MPSWHNYRGVVYVPKAASHNAEVREAINDLTRHCGGVTVTDARGEWVDPDTKEVVSEDVEVYEWRGEAPVHVEHVVRATLRSGEKAVLIVFETPSYSTTTMLTHDDYGNTP